MWDQEVKDRIELEKSGSICGGCSGMARVLRDNDGDITAVSCRGHEGKCVAIRDGFCAKHRNLCPTKAHDYLPHLARAMRVTAQLSA